MGAYKIFFYPMKVGMPQGLVTRSGVERTWPLGWREANLGVSEIRSPLFLMNSILFLLIKTVSSVSVWLMFLDRLD